MCALRKLKVALRYPGEQHYEPIYGMGADFEGAAESAESRGVQSRW